MSQIVAFPIVVAMYDLKPGTVALAMAVLVGRAARRLTAS